MKVIQQFETAIQGGGVDVLVEIVARDDDAPRFAQASVANLEQDEDLDLSVRDVRAVHDLTGRVLAAMESNPDSPPHQPQDNQKGSER